MKKFFFAICVLTMFSVFANPVIISKDEANSLLISVLLLYMLYAGIIETFILWCFKYHGWKNLSYIFGVNLISNFMVNVCIYCSDNVEWMRFIKPSIWSILILEILAILFEYALLGIRLKHNKRLLGYIVIANFISFVFGLLSVYFSVHYELVSFLSNNIIQPLFFH